MSVLCSQIMTESDISNWMMGLWELQDTRGGAFLAKYGLQRKKEGINIA